MKNVLLPGLIALLCLSFSPGQLDDPRVLVFSKTESFRHSSIETGIEAIQDLGLQHGFAVDASEDASLFTMNNLKRYDAVVFLNTTGDILNEAQQGEFERFIQAGGGYVGIHSATDTEYDWPWYGKLAGAYFSGHPNNPNVRNGLFRVLDKSHLSTEGLPDQINRSDEFYNYRSINPDIHVLIDIDETSYEGGTNGDYHPMSWHHEYDGGRAWYTGMGHTEESFSEPFFLQHLLGGIRYAMGSGELDYAKARPEENRFTKTILTEGLDEPMELAILPDERVLFVERKGAVKLYTPGTEEIKEIAKLSVSTVYENGNVAEDGLLGLALDPGFSENGWIYMFYSPSGDDPKNVLSRFHLDGDVLDLSTERVLLEVPVQRDECCHTGGSITFDAVGNLYLSTGDNTNPHATGYGPMDERPGREPWDAQKSSANTNDLRGKILRITPQADGSYTIPEGNLFAEGTPQTRPEIYTMGHRNPFRISVDQRTGFLYWGDVGPDASQDSLDRGPAGHDEFNQAREAGNYGWPHFVADNKAYNHFDFAAQSSGAKFDVARPVNTSPNNTGLTELPPAQPAYIWYSAGPSEDFPLLGSGGRSAMAGPVYYREDFSEAARPFPNYYDGKLFIYEWMRGWIMTVTMEEAGDIVSMDRFMPSHRFSNPMDMAFGPNGDLYVLEYGSGWFTANEDARLVRIEYNAGNRPPAVQLTADKNAGAIPLNVSFSSEGTNDPDSDALTYAWVVKDQSGNEVTRHAGPTLSYTLEQAGVYQTELSVTDTEGATVTSETRIIAGNEPPEVDIDLLGCNRTFYFPDVPIEYAIRVSDLEDGSLLEGTISESQVAVSADYLREGFDLVEIAQGHRSADASVLHATGKELVEAGTCLSCHQLDGPSIGPSYMAVANKYDGEQDAQSYLAGKIREGGSGVWGDAMMPPHVQLSEEEVDQMAAYILSLAKETESGPSIPIEGTYLPPETTKEGVIMLRAAYTDKGANGLPGALSEETLILRNATLDVSTGELSEGVMKFSGPQFPGELTIVMASGTYAKLPDIDLTSVAGIRFTAMVPPQLQGRGGIIEVRLDSPDGPVIGKTGLIDKMPPTQYETAIESATGQYDLYFVFKNEEPGEGGLFVVTTAEFRSATAEHQDHMGDQHESSSASGLSTNSPIKDLLADEKATGILEKHLPGLTSNPQLQQAMDMSLRAIAPFAPDTFTDEVLEAIDKDLAGE